MAAWGLGLLVVVGAALAGSGAEGEAIPDPSPAARAEASRAVPVSRTEVAIGQPGAVILDSPATANQVISSSDLVVHGYVPLGTGHVQVLLQSRSAEPIVVATVRPRILSDHRGRVQPPQFTATLALPEPRPEGPAVVQVVAYDVIGRAMGLLLRPILIGPLLDPTYGDGTVRPPTGEDGLMGGITSGTNFSWVSDGR